MCEKMYLMQRKVCMDGVSTNNIKMYPLLKSGATHSKVIEGWVLFMQGISMGMNVIVFMVVVGISNTAS